MWAEEFAQSQSSTEHAYNSSLGKQQECFRSSRWPEWPHQTTARMTLTPWLYQANRCCRAAGERHRRSQEQFLPRTGWGVTKADFISNVVSRTCWMRFCLVRTRTLVQGERWMRKKCSRFNSAAPSQSSELACCGVSRQE